MNNAHQVLLIAPDGANVANVGHVYQRFSSDRWSPL